jgi:hypothetical protein
VFTSVEDVKRHELRHVIGVIFNIVDGIWRVFWFDLFAILFTPKFLTKVAYLTQQFPDPKTRTEMACVIRKIFNERYFYEIFNWSNRDGKRALKMTELTELVLCRKFFIYKNLGLAYSLDYS